MDLYVGNVPHGTLAPDLVKFLQRQVLLLRPSNAASAAAPVLRCELKRKGRSTYAFVTLSTSEIAEALQQNGAVVFGGRILSIRRANAAFRRPMGTAPAFKCGGLQLCTEWPPGGELTCLWAVKSEVKFQVRSDMCLSGSYRLVP